MNRFRKHRKKNIPFLLIEPARGQGMQRGGVDPRKEGCMANQANIGTGTGQPRHKEWISGVSKSCRGPAKKGREEARLTTYSRLLPDNTQLALLFFLSRKLPSSPYFPWNLAFSRSMLLREKKVASVVSALQSPLRKVEE